jgi:hypothetical protein
LKYADAGSSNDKMQAAIGVAGKFNAKVDLLEAFYYK